MFSKIVTQKRVAGNLRSRKCLAYTLVSCSCLLLSVQKHRLHHGVIEHDRVSTTFRWCIGACDECWHRCLPVGSIDSVSWIDNFSDVYKFSVCSGYRYLNYHNVNLTHYSAPVLYAVSSLSHPYNRFMYERWRKRSRSLLSDQPRDLALW